MKTYFELMRELDKKAEALNKENEKEGIRVIIHRNGVVKTKKPGESFRYYAKEHPGRDERKSA